MDSKQPTGPRPLSAFDATMLVMGGIIGVGIFFTPSRVAQLVADPTLFLVLWAAGAVVAICGGFTFAELGASIPRSGGWFVFLREAFGRPVAFLFAWMILGVVTTAAVAVIVDFGADQVVGLFKKAPPYGTKPPPDYIRAKFVVGVALILFMNGLRLCGLKVGASFQNFCMLTKLIAIAALVFAGLAIGLPEAAESANAAGNATGGGATTSGGSGTANTSIWAGIVAASLSVLFSYGGWQNVCYVAPQVREPSRTMPKAIVVGVLCVGLVYLVVNVAYLTVLGVDGLAADPGFAARLARDTLGPGFERALRAVLGVSAIGVALVTILVCPDLYVAMAKERLFFASFEKRHARTGAPVLAIVLQTALALGYFAWVYAEWLFELAPLPKGEQRMSPGGLLDTLVFAEWIFHGLAAAALLRLRATRPELPRPFRMPLWPLPAWTYAGVAAFVVIGNVLSSQAQQVLIGVAILAAGAIVYVPWSLSFGRSSRSPPSFD